MKCNNFVENPTTSEKITFTGSAISTNYSIGQVEVSIDGGNTWGPVKKTGTDFSVELGRLPDGDYPIMARAFDTLGNIGQCKAINLIIDRLQPTIGGNIIAFGPQILYPMSDGAISLVAGAESSVVISMRGGVISASIKSLNNEFPLKRLKGTDLWESRVIFDKKESSQLVVSARDGAGNSTQRAINIFSAENYGSVIDNATKKPIKGATVTLYIFDNVTKSWTTWDSMSYGQKNPQTTNHKGQYSFLVPKGKYYVEIKKSGYQTSMSEITDFDENAVLNTTVTLVPYSQLGLSLGYFLPRSYEIKINKPIASIIEGSVKIGQEIPQFSFPKTNGTIVTKSDVKGSKYILMFFSPWSSLSIEGISQISGHYQKLKKATEIIPVAVQESTSALETFLARGKYKIPALADYDGKYSSDIGVTTLPYYVFVGPDHKIANIFVGVLNYQELLKIVSQMP